MNIGDWLSQLNKDIYILVPGLYVLGMFMKNTPRIPDYYIPWILLFISTSLSVLILGFTAQAVVEGIIVTGVTVFANQIWKQANGKKAEDKYKQKVEKKNKK